MLCTTTKENLSRKLRVAGSHKNEIKLVVIASDHPLQILLCEEVCLPVALLILEQQTVTIIAVLFEELLTECFSGVLDTVARPVESFWRWLPFHQLFE